MKYYIPAVIVVLSNTFYHICAKSAPEDMNPFASLTATYLVAAAASLLLYFLTRKGGDLLAEYRQLNWSSVILGLAIVGLEGGFLYMYKAGWNVSTGQLVTSAVLAVVLIVVGRLLYRETVTPGRLAGVAICMVGLYFINK